MSRTFLVETFPAELADEGLVAGVDADVRVERGAPVERLPALRALMRLLLTRGNKQKKTIKRRPPTAPQTDQQSSDIL